MNDTVTAILSGTNNPYSIRTFDWRTMLYHEQPVQFSKARHYCGCALLKIDGQLLVAVSGKFFDVLSSRNISSTGGPRYMRSFYLRFCVYAIEKWPFLYVNLSYASLFLESLSLAHNEVHLYYKNIIKRCPRSCTQFKNF